MRNSSLEYAVDWDFDYNDDLVSETGNNDWENASLNTLLNESYYKNIDDVTYYSARFNYSTEVFI